MYIFILNIMYMYIYIYIMYIYIYVYCMCVFVTYALCLLPGSLACFYLYLRFNIATLHPHQCSMLYPSTFCSLRHLTLHAHCPM